MSTASISCSASLLAALTTGVKFRVQENKLLISSHSLNAPNILLGSLADSAPRCRSQSPLPSSGSYLVERRCQIGYGKAICMHNGLAMQVNNVRLSGVVHTTPTGHYTSDTRLVCCSLSTTPSWNSQPHVPFQAQCGVAACPPVVIEMV